MKTRIGWVVIGATVMGLLLAAVITMTRTGTVVDLIRADQKAGIARSKESLENTERIKKLASTIESCTTPKGECYLRSQAQTGEAVASINDVIIAAAVCAKRPDVNTTAQARACIKHELNVATR